HVRHRQAGAAVQWALLCHHHGADAGRHLRPRGWLAAVHLRQRCHQRRHLERRYTLAGRHRVPQKGLILLPTSLTNLPTMLYFLLLLLAAIVLFSVRAYNGLQKLAQNVRESASNVQVAISKKLSSINQLIEVVKNFQAGEQLVQLQVSQDQSAAAMSNAYQQSGTVLSTIQGVADRFTNLKASEQYHRLINNIETCEADIGTARTKYNGVVKQYNSYRLGIPTVFIARSMGFGEAPYLQFDQSGAADPN